ncbi:MAG: hypothetical protein QM724_03875 [Flavobacteriales bacterium]
MSIRIGALTFRDHRSDHTKSCLYVEHFGDSDLKVLRELAKQAYPV